MFVAGPSLGASLAPEIARRDADVAGAILLAPYARRIADIVVEQAEFHALSDDGAISSEEVDRVGAALRLYPRLDHLFVAREGRGSPEQYRKPANVEEKVVADLASWIWGGRLPPP